MQHRPLLPAATLLSALLLAGCAVDNRYPSLSPRPIEDVSLAEPATAPPPRGTSSAEATARYAPLVEKARAADAGFRRVLESERPAMTQGRNAAAGSDAWLAGQVALTRVEAARNPMTAALADLDAARNEPAPQTDTGLATAVTQAYATVHALDRAEADAIARAWPKN